MKFNTGDLVSLVDAKGGGMVVSVNKNGSYKIAMDDGFTMDYKEKELVLVKAVDNKREGDSTVDLTQKQHLIKENKLFTTPENEITFIVVPSRENQVLTGDISFYLSNQTSLFLHFVLGYVQNRKHFFIHASTLNPGEEIKAGEFPRSYLTEWENFHIQVLLYTQDKYDHYLPIAKDLPLLLPDIQNHSAEKGRLGFARHLQVYRLPTMEDISFDELKDKFENSKEKSKLPAPPFPKGKANKMVDDSRFGIHHITREVDLHITALLKVHSHLTNSEMLNHQLTRFRKEMDHAIMNHFRSIVFIHGVGEGVLRKALLDELINYNGINYRNGTYEKYGAGAIEVLF